MKANSDNFLFLNLIETHISLHGFIDPLGLVVFNFYSILADEIVTFSFQILLSQDRWQTIAQTFVLWS